MATWRPLGNTDVLEGNRFQGECQNLTGDIFMAASPLLVYTIRLVMLCWQRSGLRAPLLILWCLK
ncbi:MAG: hypothetical protein KJ630_15325 [Proteobacteria bacterium]|nr:hypothetical protein [Pseudomonadota bacterium]